jgi:hypothetical protein
MAKNKSQKAAEERAAKAATQTTEAPAEQPKAEPKPAATPVTATATPAPANKQTQTIEKLKEGWAARGVDLSKLSIRDDGKFKLLVVAEGWPTVRLGSTGGITVVELKSYTRAFDAAMDGLALYQKQQAREQKKASATQPAAKQQAVTA